MLGIRPYKPSDAKTVISWIESERQFYQWSAGRMGEYPVTAKGLGILEKIMSFTAFDEAGEVGFFTLRVPENTSNELRLGFIILNPEKRGKGYGKKLLYSALKFVFELYGADKASIGVFENNPNAYHCYKAVGFKESGEAEMYRLSDEEWNCIMLYMTKAMYYSEEKPVSAEKD